MRLDEFNEADRADAIAVLQPCADIPRWYEAVADDRPYASVEALWAEGMTAADPFTADEVESALAHHPRIGERPEGDGREAAMSRSEQSGVQPGEALREGNLAYEERFGRVFLIRAAGRSADEILAVLNERLTHSPDEEDLVVAGQLREIALLRLKGAVTR